MLGIVGAIVSALISATFGTLTLWGAGIIDCPKIFATWSAWWFGDGLSDLVIAPFLFVWLTGKFRAEFRTPRLWAEGAFLSLLILITSWVIFGPQSQYFPRSSALAYLGFPLLIWVALRFGQRGSITGSLAISVFAIWGTALGYGPFSQGTFAENILFLEIYRGCVAVTVMFLAAAVAEQSASEKLEEQTQTQLRKAIDARDEFLSIASHELKSPLTSLGLQLQLTDRRIKPDLNQGPSWEDLSKTFKRSIRQVKSLSRLVDELLDVSKIQRGELVLNREDCDLSELVRSTLEQFGEQLIVVECPIEVDLPLTLWGSWDPHRIEQVLVNLISNVIKYAPGKLVKISASASEDRATLSVEDFGRGIPAEKQTKIFERFERATSATHISGLGLGLFVVKQIIDAHQGTIRLDSAEGKGSKFIVDLPRHGGPLSHAQPGQ